MIDEWKLDTTDFPAELIAVLELMKTCLDDSALAKAGVKWPADVDWPALVQLLIHHRIYPLLYPYLKNGGQAGVPESAMQILRAAYHTNAFQMLRLGRETGQLSRELADRHIPCLMLKGPVLAEYLNGDTSLRTSKDLDLLVPAADVEQTESVLTSLGYILTDDPVRVLDWKWKIYHIAYSHPEKNIQIEVHWRMNPGMVREPGFTQLWERRRITGSSQYPVYSLGDNDLFLYLVSHGARHGWFRLRWLTDIDRLSRKPLDTAGLTKLLAQYDCLHLAGQALLLASRLFGTPVAEDMSVFTAGKQAQQLAASALVFIRNKVQLCPDPPPELAKSYRRYLFSLKNSRQKWQVILSQLYPSSKDALLLPLPKYLHFLYFPLRPFLWFWRQIRHRSAM